MLSDNYRSWLFRGLAHPAAVDAAQHAIEVGATSEVQGQAHLDLADAHERAGRYDDAADAMRAAHQYMGTRWFHNRWRCDQRSGLIEARLLLASGDGEGALACATTVATAAEARGDLRYASMARLHVVLARMQCGDPVDPAAVLADAGIVARVAMPEAWRLAADVADALGDDRGGRAVREVGVQAGAFLATEAGDRSEHLRRVLADRLG